MINTQKVVEKFESLYSNKPLLISSPGRINLIGEHTDYNDGFVLPAAIDKRMILGFAKNNSNIIRLHSIDLNDDFACNITKVKVSEKSWVNYILGVVNQLQEFGYDVEGFDCVFTSNIPMGSGLSSSAALECGVGFGLNELFDLDISKIDLIKFAQKAEHTFAGVQCGIMDQFASVMGVENQAFRLDCRSLEYDYYPIHFPSYQFILCNSGVKHSLADSEYNTRRSECETGVIAIQKKHPEVTHLRDITIEMLTKIKADISPTVYNRCEYIIEENNRVIKACKALNTDAIAIFGKLMYASHNGLSNLYEVSCKELDFLVDFTRNNDAILGSRMMGGGFGGCTINLVKRSEKEQFLKNIKEAYLQEYNIDLECYEVEISDGTSVINTVEHV